MERIPVTGPWITEKEVDYVADAVRNGWYENATVYHSRFERALADYVGRKFALAVPHCTTAIHLALLAAQVGPGDEVIVPEITWIGSSAPIHYVGAIPVFADIDPVTWCLSAESFERSITPRTKAVILVDLYGILPDMMAIQEIADRRGIVIIEDAAQSLGASLYGKRAGSFGLASTFSFHGTKLLTTGEGGMLLTDDEEFYRQCRHLADHGRDTSEKLLWNTKVAFKYKMSALQAAMGLAQLERIEELVQRRRQIFFWYREALQAFPGLQMNCEPPGVFSTFWMTTVIWDRSYCLAKETVMAELSDKEIATRPFQYPLSQLPAYSDLPGVEAYQERNSTAYDLSPRGINLPSGFNMTEEKVHYVVDCFREILSGRSLLAQPSCSGSAVIV